MTTRPARDHSGSTSSAERQGRFSQAMAGHREREHGARAGLGLLVTWVVFSLANVGSHRSYEVASIVVFVATAGVLLAVLALRIPLRLPEPPGAALPVVLLALGSVLVFQPTYMPSHSALLMRLTIFACTIAILMLWLQRRVPTTAASLGFTSVVAGVAAWFPIHGVPHPGNDVWYLLQQSNEGLVRGENMYKMTWIGVPPGQVTDVFTYFPMSSILMAPSRWLTGDVRWGMAVLVLLSAVLLLSAARPPRRAKGSVLWCAPACLLVLTPGHPLQIEMSWTEPLLLFLLLGVLVATQRERRWVAIGCLALALASKQHVWVLLPLFASWHPFGLRRVGLAILGAVLICLPWIVAEPRAMYADTVGSYLKSGTSERSSTLPTLMGRLGIGLPAAVAVGLLVVAISYCCHTLHRRGSTLAGFCLASALVLLVGNFLNKQAYYNQWWLVGSLVLASLAFSSASGDDVQKSPGANAPA